MSWTATIIPTPLSVNLALWYFQIFSWKPLFIAVDFLPPFISIHHLLLFSLSPPLVLGTLILSWFFFCLSPFSFLDTCRSPSYPGLSSLLSVSILGHFIHLTPMTPTSIPVYQSLASVSVLHILLLFNKSTWILHRQLKANLPKTETHQLACLHTDFQFQAIVSPDWIHPVSKDARLENETQLSSSFSNSAKSQNLLDSLPLHYLYCLGAGSYPSHLDIWTNLIPSSGILYQTSIPKPPLREFS